jgi:hypothetical protein
MGLAKVARSMAFRHNAEENGAEEFDEMGIK